jgi:CheY-like chemotaxis protein
LAIVLNFWAIYFDRKVRRNEVLGMEVIMKYPRILIVDDDAVFSQILSRAAIRKGIFAKTVSNLSDVGHPTSWDFDVAVVDYDLRIVNGVEFTDYLNHFGANFPIVLVSGRNREDDGSWPKNIRGFVRKDKGNDAILKEIERVQGDS